MVWTLFALHAGGQQRTAELGVTADRVMVSAVVMDRRERLITNLAAGDFQLTVDKAPTAIDSFWREDAPVSAVIVFDASGSMRPELGHARASLRSFLDQARPEDEYALVLCKDRPELAVAFTSDTGRVLSYPDLGSAHGSTALYDAIALAVEESRKARHSRKVIFVVSDGRDNHSRWSGKELRKKLAEADVYLYAVELWTPEMAVDSPPRVSLLDSFAETTGGVYFGDVTARELAKLLGRLDIHQQYLLTFRPRGRSGDGKYHSVGLKLAGDRAGSHARLYWRHGYYDLDPRQIR